MATIVSIAGRRRMDKPHPQRNSREADAAAARPMLPNWLTTSLVIPILAGTWSLGLYTGRQESAVAMSALEQRVTAHVDQGRHMDAVSVDAYSAQLQALQMRLERLERLIEDLRAEIVRLRQGQ